MSMAKSSSSSSSERESISGEALSVSGVSLTAAVLTHPGHQDDSIDDDIATATAAAAVVSQQAGGGGEGDRERGGRGRGRGRKRENLEGEGEGDGSGVGVPPSKAGRRRLRSSPSKKRENEDGIRELLDNIPEVAREFEIISKIGEGTFSSVYMASVKGVPEERFAIKHLIPTSASSRIENELKFMQILGGRDNVMSVCCCLRHRDHVALVMPYFQHDRFADYLPRMTVSEARCYMRALFLALRNIHSHHIIHRDIKPSNFLCNRATQQFQLVDFGLAHLESEKHSSHSEQKVRSKSRPLKRSSSRLLQSSVPTINLTNLTTKVATATTANNNINSTTLTSTTTTTAPCPITSTATTTTTTTTRITRINGIIAPPPQTYQRQLHHRATTRAAVGSHHHHRGASSTIARGIGGPRPAVSGQITRKREGGGGGGEGGRVSAAAVGAGGAERGRGGRGEEVIRLCPLRHKVTEVCTACLARSHQAAPRAGTPGFRAPEVLLKYPHQTTAVDVWSAGVIFLCILSGRYPFFKAHDDMSALAQIVSLMGSRETIDAARTFGKHLVCEPEVIPVMDLKTLCSTLRASLSSSSSSSLSSTSKPAQLGSRRGERDTQPTPPKRTKRSSNREREHGPSYNNLTPPPPAHPASARASTRSSPRIQSLRGKLISGCGGAAAGLESGSGHDSDGGSGSDSDSWDQIPDSAYDLLYRCLDLNPATRITANLALQHSFIVDNR